MRADQRDQDDRDQHHVPQQHLAEVHQVEERADPGRVERVLAVGRDPLRVEVLLRQVPGEALHDRGDERDHAGDPGERAAAAPGRHPELAPQVDDQERHEQLDAPQVNAVEEVADRVGVPPVGAAERDRESADDRHAERRERGHAEHVHPGRDVRRLAVRQQLLRRQYAERPAACPGRPHPGVGLIAALPPRPQDPARQRTPPGRRARAAGGHGAVAPAGERRQQRDAEDGDHDGDQHQVGLGNREDRPVQVPAWRVEIHGQRGVRCEEDVHGGLQG